VWFIGLSRGSLLSPFEPQTPTTLLTVESGVGQAGLPESTALAERSDNTLEWRYYGAMIRNVGAVGASLGESESNPPSGLVPVRRLSEGFIAPKTRPLEAKLNQLLRLLLGALSAHFQARTEAELLRKLERCALARADPLRDNPPQVASSTRPHSAPVKQRGLFGRSPASPASTLPSTATSTPQTASASAASASATPPSAAASGGGGVSGEPSAASLASREQHIA